MEKGMATHSSILAWKIPWTEEPGRLWGLKESPPILVFSRVLSCTCGFRVKLIHYIKCYILILHLLSTFLGFPVHGILQARILQWIALSSSRGLPNPRIEPASHESQALVGRFYTMSTTWEVPGHRILIAQSEGIFSSFSKILDFAFPPAVILMVTI